MSEKTAPQFDANANKITFPSVDHVEFFVNGRKVEDSELVIERDTVVRVRAERGFVLAKSVEKEHRFKVTKPSDDTPPPADENDEDSKDEDKTPPPATAGNTPQAPGQTSGQARPSGSVPRL